MQAKWVHLATYREDNDGLPMILIGDSYFPQEIAFEIAMQILDLVLAPEKESSK